MILKKNSDYTLTEKVIMGVFSLLLTILIIFTIGYFVFKFNRIAYIEEELRNQSVVEIKEESNIAVRILNIN